MRIRGTSFYLRWISLLFIFGAILLTVLRLVNYSRLRANYPPAMTIAGVPVGSLDPQSAAQRLLQVYALPVEIQYGGSIIHLDPTQIGFELNIESMLAAADLQRTGSSFWGGFWDYLWNRQPAGADVPLIATYSRERLRLYLQNEISARYDYPPIPAQAVPGSAEFTSGTPGQTLDIERAVIFINDALYSPSARTVVLSSQRTAAARPSMASLKLILQDLIDQNEFDGLVGLYLLDLQTSEELQLAYRNGVNFPVNPDVAFTGASTIKIPIMVSVFRHFNGNTDDETATLLQDTFRTSDNGTADALMKILDEIRGPLIVTEDMFTLGLENTFMAGYFCTPQNPCPPLDHFDTPANLRKDVNTDPDIYNQTTPSDMGILLEDIYQCAQSGGGALVAAFPGQINQAACQQMILYLEEDRTGVLIEAGLPVGTRLAHKHGWVTDQNGELHNFSDAAIVYTPGGNYVLCIYIYNPNLILFDSANHMYAELSRAIYNYFNIP